MRRSFDIIIFMSDYNDVNANPREGLKSLAKDFRSP